MEEKEKENDEKSSSETSTESQHTNASKSIDEKFKDSIDEKFKDSIDEKFKDSIDEKFKDSIDEKFKDSIDEKFSGPIDEKFKALIQDKIKYSADTYKGPGSERFKDLPKRYKDSIDEQYRDSFHGVESLPDLNTKFPKSVFFIFGNEFCERYSYFGMRSILTIYLVEVLLYNQDQATIIYHSFIIACFVTPIFGAILSDSFLGKFKTIFYISMVHALGNIILSTATITTNVTHTGIITAVGLVLLAIGTGGIKPCVSSFGGDQFLPTQEHHRERFFSLFYLSINIGSITSTFLSPIFRDSLHCLGRNSCFVVAFGIPAILMMLAIIILLLGKRLYIIRPPQGNIIGMVASCIWHAISRKCQSKEKRNHWLEYANDRYSDDMIQDIKKVLRICLLNLAFPVFWSLYAQQGSRWTLQAIKMSGKINSDRYFIKADQMQVFNPLLVVILVPVFQYFIYPFSLRCGFLTTPLQRITIGGLIAGSAFVYAGFLELKINENMPTLPESGMSQIFISNNSPCNLSIENGYDRALEPHETKLFFNAKMYEDYLYKVKLRNKVCEGYNNTIPKIYFDLKPESPVTSVVITVLKTKLKAYVVTETKEKSKIGSARVRLYYSLFKTFDNKNKFYLKNGYFDTYFVVPKAYKGLSYGVTDIIEIEPGPYTLQIFENSTFNDVLSINFQQGEVTLIFLYENPTKQIYTRIYQIVPPNKIFIMYQIPQYFLLTSGEVMFSITGLEFSYSQAPKSMKAVLQAVWLLNVALGNLITLIIVKAKLFKNEGYQFFMFAGLMGLDMVVFAIMAYFYKYAITEAERDLLKTDGQISISLSYAAAEEN